MDDTQKKQNFQLVNISLRILTIVYFLIQFVFLRWWDLSCLLTTIPIMIVAVRKRKDTVNKVISIIASAGIVFYFIGRYYLPDSWLYESNGDMTLFGQLHSVIWILSLFTGIYVLPFRELMKASEENGAKGMKIRILGYSLLILSAIPAITLLGFLLWMVVTNYYP